VKLLRPPALRVGDVIAVVAPASAPSLTRLARGVATLESLGYRVKVMPETRTRSGRFAGDDRRRAAALRRALADDRVRGIVFARGGFGSARMLPLVEADLRRAGPKIMVGYSDATTILAYASGELGWVTFHGPMVASDFPTLRDGDRRRFREAVGGEPIRPFELSRIHRRGLAEGRLLGGCLSVLVSLLGTPYEPRFAGAILFLEDVNEEPYRLDRMLTQLRLAGALRRVRGIVFANLTRCGSPTEMHAVLAERTRDLGVPVAYGLASGHGRAKRTLPLGVRARLDANAGTLEILEPPIEP
jgi:muramoyltetrapeptide carboxypeptidase